MLLGDYAHNPLVLKTDSSDTRVGSIVSSQLFLHLNATLALWNRLAINVDVPVALLQDGDSSNASGAALSAPTKAQFGDLRAGARLRLFGDYHDIFQVAVGGYVWFPTGGDGFVSDKKVRGLPSSSSAAAPTASCGPSPPGPSFAPPRPSATSSRARC